MRFSAAWIRRDLQRRRALPQLGKPFYLKPLAQITTPGQLQVKTKLAAVGRYEQQRRRGAHSKLRAPTAIATTSGGLLTFAADGPGVSLTPTRGALLLPSSGSAAGPVSDAVLTRPLRVLAQMIG